MIFQAPDPFPPSRADGRSATRRAHPRRPRPRRRRGRLHVRRWSPV